jgi:hypothetical protein
MLRDVRDAMLKQEETRVNNNVTYLMCTHRLVTHKMHDDAPRHPHPIWPYHPPHTRGTEN